MINLIKIDEIEHKYDIVHKKLTLTLFENLKYFVARVKVQFWSCDPASFKLLQKWVVLITIQIFFRCLGQSLKKLSLSLYCVCVSCFQGSDVSNQT